MSDGLDLVIMRVNKFTFGDILDYLGGRGTGVLFLLVVVVLTENRQGCYGLLNFVFPGILLR